jgi:hypothetical protein
MWLPFEAACHLVKSLWARGKDPLKLDQTKVDKTEIVEAGERLQ